jgi:beta-glucosidase
MKKFIWIIFLAAFSSFSCSPSEEVIQLKLGYRTAAILEENGFQFKDLNKNNRLDPYEDWRLPVDQRIQNLIAQMSLEEKVGFMLISTSDLKVIIHSSQEHQKQKSNLDSMRKT